MINFVAQAQSGFWSAPNGSSELFTKLFLGLVVGFGILAGLMFLPITLRRYVVAFVTFFSGLYWVLFYVWPVPIGRKPGQLPNGSVEGVGFWLSDANSTVASIGVILAAFLIGMGIYSLLRVHLSKLLRRKPDWGFSLVLLSSMVAMIVLGYWDWKMKLGPKGADLAFQQNWTFVQYGRDLLFEGLLQQMDAAMFSVIAFYIMSAAYRAFRIRSIEATILLATALIVIISSMGAVTFKLDAPIIAAAKDTPILGNFQLTEIAKWIRGTFQTASLQGIGFGVGIGALAMGLRLWLSLEKTGGKN